MLYTVEPCAIVVPADGMSSRLGIRRQLLVYTKRKPAASCSGWGVANDLVACDWRGWRK